MKTILGLDLGSSSIGWALVKKSEESKQIIDLGSRIIPLSIDETNEFASGQKMSKNQNRTKARTTRKGYDRYQLRRAQLLKLLESQNMLPSDSERKLPKLELWKLRAEAVERKISLNELGRVLLHINQKRGYKSGRKEGNNKEETNYVKAIEERREELNGKTVGQYLYQELLKNEYFRVKNNIFFRQDYMEECSQIIEEQKKYYPNVLTDKFVSDICEETIFYQRPLKSQKGLVSVCEFEGFKKKNKDGKEVFVGPKVAPKSSPIAELCKIWENINNLKLKDKFGNQYEFSLEDKQKIFAFMKENEKLTFTNLLKILGLKKESGFEANKQLEKGIEASKTYTKILKCLDDKNSEYLKFDVNIVSTEKELVDENTGEIVKRKEISSEIEKEPLYKLWHTIYSIQEPSECKNALKKHFPLLSEEEAEKLSQITEFNTSAFSNKSARCMRKILPYLMEGQTYDKAMSSAAYNHSNSKTKQENLERELKEKLDLLPKNSLRQPVVEKILNQMINLVNAILTKHGSIDEIRIELARELKQSAGEREETSKFMNKRDKENKVFTKEIQSLGYRASKNNILKYRLFKEIENKIQPICLYCGQPISISQTLSGEGIEIEHILPKALVFDDSQSNKILAHRNCNLNKSNQTAYDFMKSKSAEEFEAYVERVEYLYKDKAISKTKRDKLLLSSDKMREGFIERQLRESQYIAKKAVEILSEVNRNVLTTGGGITAFIRELWGWNEVLENINVPIYKEFEGLVDTETYEHKGQMHTREKIKDWTKRDDHRHHAIDALVIACTEQGFIQRINTLSNKDTREKMYEETKNLPKDEKKRRTLLEDYLLSQKPFSTNEVQKAAEGVLISIKSGKKVSTFGTRKVKKEGKKQVVQSGIIVPRGKLSEETVYGKIKQPELKGIKYLLENSNDIVDKKIKELVEERISYYKNDKKKAIESLKKKPIILDKSKQTHLAQANCFCDVYVVKYPVDINFNKVDDIIDGGIKKILKTRLEKFGNNPKEAFKDVSKEVFEDDNLTTKSIKWYEDEGLEKPIISVRCKTGLTAVVPINDEKGFVKPGNNHNMVIYKTEEGKFEPRICTFWEAVNRKMYGVPVIVTKPNEFIDKIEELEEKFETKYKDKPTYEKHRKAFDEILTNLPKNNWKLDKSFVQNQMYILGLDTETAMQAIENKDYASLGRYIYRVQKMTMFDIYFSLQYETKDVTKLDAAKKSNRVYRISSIGALEKLNPIKIHINCIGELTKVGE